MLAVDSGNKWVRLAGASWAAWLAADALGAGRWCGSTRIPAGVGVADVSSSAGAMMENIREGRPLWSIVAVGIGLFGWYAANGRKSRDEEEEDEDEKRHRGVAELFGWDADGLVGDDDEDEPLPRSGISRFGRISQDEEAELTHVPADSAAHIRTVGNRLAIPSDGSGPYAVALAEAPVPLDGLAPRRNHIHKEHRSMSVIPSACGPWLPSLPCVADRSWASLGWPVFYSWLRGWGCLHCVAWRTRMRGSLASVVSVRPPLAVTTRPIEDVQLGDRAFGRNPLREQVDETLPDPNPATWRKLKLHMVKQNGLSLWIELLRSRNGSKPRGQSPARRSTLNFQDGRLSATPR